MEPFDFCVVKFPVAAISSFNPLYGQGMSVPALEAIELRRCLERGRQRLARRFFRAAGKVVAPAWGMAVGGDLALPEIEGDRPLVLRLTNAYVERLLQVAEQDAAVAAAFNEVADLLAPPQNVMRPRVLWRVLRGPRQPQPAEASDPSAGSLPQSAIVDAMRARAMTVRSGAGTERSAPAETKDAAPRR